MRIAEVEAIVDDLGGADHLRRVRCAQRLREEASAEVVEAVIERGLADGRANAQAEAARLAGDVGHGASARALRALVMDGRRAVRVRKAAASALGLLGDLEGIEALEAALGHPDAMFRRAVVEAAGRIGGSRALGLLRSWLGAGVWQVRMEAAVGLGGMPVEVAGEAIEGLMGAVEVEGHDETAEQMLRSLAELGVRAEGHRGAVEVALRGHLEPVARWRASMAAARGLGELGAVGSMEALRGALRRDPPLPVAEQVVWALGRLSPPG